MFFAIKILHIQHFPTFSNKNSNSSTKIQTIQHYSTKIQIFQHNPTLFNNNSNNSTKIHIFQQNSTIFDINLLLVLGHLLAV